MARQTSDTTQYDARCPCISGKEFGRPGSLTIAEGGSEKADRAAIPNRRAHFYLFVPPYTSTYLCGYVYRLHIHTQTTIKVCLHTHPYTLLGTLTYPTALCALKRLVIRVRSLISKYS